MKKIILMLGIVMILVINGCDEKPPHWEYRDVSFFCIEGDEIIRDTLIIKSQYRGKTSLGITQYWYDGNNNIWIYDDCFLKNNGYKFNPSDSLFRGNGRCNYNCIPCE